MIRTTITLMLLALTACGDVQYVEATPVPEVSAAPLEGDDQ